MAVSPPRQLDRRTASEIGRVDSHVRLDEDTVFASRMRILGRRVHLAVVAERPDLALDSAGQIVSLSDRRLRQLGGGNAA